MKVKSRPRTGNRTWTPSYVLEQIALTGVTAREMGDRELWSVILPQCCGDYRKADEWFNALRGTAAPLRRAEGAWQRRCIGCLVMFEPTHFRQKFCRPSCRKRKANAPLLKIADAKSEERGAVEIAGG